MNLQEHSEPIRIFWTGGWDSTYRVAYAALVLGQRIEPFYLIDPGRGSLHMEVRAMQAIRRCINDKAGMEMFAPMRFCSVDDLPADARICDAFTRLCDKAFIGIQYQWLARWAGHLGGRRIELTIHVDDRAYEHIAPYLVPDAPQAKDRRVTGPESPADVAAVFGRFSYPIVDLSKRRMAAQAEQHGFADVMDLTWFCHLPRRGRPCGRCNPCRYTLDEGMGHRIPPLRRLMARLLLTVARRLQWFVLLRRRIPGLRARANRRCGWPANEGNTR